MKSIKEETKHSSSIHQKIRKASFVTVEGIKNEKFKYEIVYSLKQELRKLLTRFKDLLVKSYQKVLLKASIFDWKEIRKDLLMWLLNVFVEGITANFATHFLLNLPFNFGMILAHGIVIKQGINIFWRLRQNGSNANIPKKHN